MVKVRKRAIPANTQLSVPSALLVPFRYSVKKFSPPPFDIPKPVLYYPVGGLHGKLTVTAKLAPGCPAFPCGVRRHDAALEPGDMSPRPSPRLVPSARNQTKSNQIKPNQTKSNHHPFSRISRFNRPRPQSRQKPQQSCIIKAYQGIRQIFQQPSVRPSTRWIGRTGYRMAKRVPRRNPLLGERKQVRASVITNQSLFAPPHPQSRQKPQQSCMIKALVKNTRPLGIWSFPIRTPKPGNRAQRRPLFPIDIRARAWLIF